MDIKKESANLPLISIIIATFNSEKTLPLVLDALFKQTYLKEKIEIILVDGGSTDNTFYIAKKYNCTVISNPKTEPVYAKFLGYLNAKGKYLIYLDHDEVLQNKNSIKRKVDIIQNNSRVKAVISNGYEKPQNLPEINNYINEFGDPFSFFIYRLSKDQRFFLKQMKQCYKTILEDNNSVVFNLSKEQVLPIIELCAMGTLVDAEYMKKEFPETLQKPQLIPHFFYLLNSKDNFIAIAKDDGILHYSAESLDKYFTKIKWRIKNNIFHKERLGVSGYLGREKFQPKSQQIKKYLFIPYAFLIIPVLYDAVFLTISRKNIFYLMHFPLVLYTASLILWYSVLQSIGYKPKLKSYDNTKVIEDYND